MAINTRSPHFESIDFAAMSYGILEVFIWTGNKSNVSGDVPTNPTYTLRKSALTPVSGNPSVSFETSELIRDYLELHLMEIILVKVYGLSIKLLHMMYLTHFC